jgi:hypothetical protein
LARDDRNAEHHTGRLAAEGFHNMTQDSATVPRRPPRPADFVQRQPVIRDVAIISVCVACLSFFINGCLELGALQQLSHVKEETAQTQQGLMRRAQIMANYNAPSPEIVKPPSVRRPFRALTPQEISGVLKYINAQVSSSSANALTKTQTEALTKRLSTEGQNLIDPDSPLFSESPGKVQLVRAWIDSDHCLSIVVRYGSALDVMRLRLDAAGLELHQKISPVVSPRLNPVPPMLSLPPSQVVSMYQGDYVSALASTVISAIDLLLAVLLFIAGILLLLWRPRGIPLHWVYASLKLLLSIFVATPIFTAWLGSSEQLIFLLGGKWALLGCVYPIALLFFLFHRAYYKPSPTEAATSVGSSSSVSHDPWQEHELLNYAVSGLGRYPPRLRNIGVASLVMSVLSLCVYSEVFVNAEWQYRILIAMLMILALLLFAGAIMLLRSDQRGVLAHKIYAALQILINIVLAGVLMEDIYNSPAGFVFYLGAIPGILGCIYPLLLFVFLRRSAIRSNA